MIGGTRSTLLAPGFYNAPPQTGRRTRASGCRMPPDLARGAELYAARLAELHDTPPLLLATELKLQTPPPGAQFDVHDLEWYEHTLRGKLKWDALVPVEDVPRFLLGEAARCGCDLFTTCSDTGVDKPDRYCEHLCPCSGTAKRFFGPHLEHARGYGKKGSGKVRCTARFSVKYNVTPGVARVRYICHEHVDACRVQAPRRVSPLAQARVLSWLLEQSSLQPVELVERNAAAAVNAYVVKHGGTNAEAKTLFHTVRARAARGAAPLARRLTPCVSRHARLSPQNREAAPPDYWLSEEDCWNIKADANTASWKLDANPVTSLRRYAALHASEVFLYQEQETKELLCGKRVETKPFIFALCPAETRGVLEARLHGGTVFCDATFGALARRVARHPRLELTLACTCVPPPQA